ncbi:YitT family protein [Agathobacter sp.]
MEFFKKQTPLVSYIMVIIGTGILAVSIQNFYDPIGLVTGGFTGLAIVIKTASAAVIPGGIPLWLTNVVLNVPVFILSYIIMGKKFVGRTLFGTAMLSAWLYIIPSVDLARGDMLLAAVFGALFSGAGMGIILRGHATTGGTEMVACLIHKKAIKHYSVVQIMQILDGLIVCLGLFQYGLRATMYAMIAIFVTTKVSDAILEGFKYSKAAYIITDHHKEIADRIMRDIDRGVTGMSARGMYTGQDKLVLYCVVSRREIVQVEEIVTEIDPDAFVIVSDVREVLGEGFQEYSQEA